MNSHAFMRLLIHCGKGFLLLLWCFLSTQPIKAQPNFADGITIGGSGSVVSHAVASDGRGGKYVVGSFTGMLDIAGQQLLTSAAGQDAFLVHYGPAGNALWVRYLHGVEVRVTAEVIMQVDAAGDVVLGGTHRNPLLLQGMQIPVPRNAYSNAWAAKYDYTGTFRWVHNFQSAGMARAPQLAMDGAGNSYVVFVEGRNLLGTSPQHSELVMAKLSPNGVVLASRTDGSNQMNGIGNYPRSLACDKATGSLFLSGWFRCAQTVADSSVTTTSGRDTYLASYNSNLTPRWVRTQVSTAPPATPMGAFVASFERLRINSQGHLLFLAFFDGTFQVGSQTFTNPTGQYKNSWLVGSYSSAGQLLWARPVQLGPYESNLYDLQPSSTGEILVCGSSNWGFVFGAYTFAPSSINGRGEPNTDGFVAAFDSQGLPLWLRQTYSLVQGQQSICEPLGLIVDSNNSISIAGYLLNTNMFNTTVLSSGSSAVVSKGFVAELDSVVTRLQFTPRSGTPGSQVVINGSGFQGTTAVRFNGLAATSFRVNAPGDQIVATVPAGASTGAISIVGPSGVIVTSESFTVSGALANRRRVVVTPEVYPNPARTSVQIRVPGTAGLVQVRLFDAVGRQQRMTQLPADEGTLDIRGLSAGVYVVQLNGASFTATQRLLIE